MKQTKQRCWMSRKICRLRDSWMKRNSVKCKLRGTIGAPSKLNEINNKEIFPNYISILLMKLLKINLELNKNWIVVWLWLI